MLNPILYGGILPPSFGFFEIHLFNKKILLFQINLILKIKCQGKLAVLVFHTKTKNFNQQQHLEVYYG